MYSALINIGKAQNKSRHLFIFLITLISIAALPPPGDIISLGAKSRPGSSSESSDSRSHGGSSLAERKRELPIGGVPIAPKKTKLISPTSLTPLGKSVDALRSTSSNVATKPEIKTIDGKVVLLSNSEQCFQTSFTYYKYLTSSLILKFKFGKLCDQVEFCDDFIFFSFVDFKWLNFFLWLFIFF